MNEDLLRECTRKIKRLAATRVPNYDLPSDSSIDGAVREIAALVAEECAKAVVDARDGDDRHAFCDTYAQAIRAKFPLPPS